MIPLRGKIQHSRLADRDRDRIVRLTTNASVPPVLRNDLVFLVRGDEVPEGFWAYATFTHRLLKKIPAHLPSFQLGDEMSHLDDGDVIRISPDNRKISVLYRRNSPHNTLLLTERCNHYCVMCSQPPKAADDSHIIGELRQLIPLISRDTQELGFSGGEPTLLGEQFFELVRLTESFLPETSLHILSNGTAFQDRDFAQKLADERHHDLMIGIPLYSDVPEIHDFIVQSSGAWDQTLRGLINLGRVDVPIELRIVIQKGNKERLPQLGDFICRNLPFVTQVSFMGLEMVGFARANVEQIWVEPDDYANELETAVKKLAASGVRTSIFNLQRCLMPPSLWQYMTKSISDWKNEYLPECESCVEIKNCGGFFSSYVNKTPRNIRRIDG